MKFSTGLFTSLVARAALLGNLLSPAATAADGSGLFDDKNVSANDSNNGRRPLVATIKVSSQADIQHLADQYDILDVDKDKMTVFALLLPHEKKHLEDVESFTVTTDDVATAELEAAAATGIAGYPCYRTVVETYATGESLANSYPHIVEWIDIGDSWEKANLGAGSGFDIFALKITNKSTSPSVGVKPVFFANCAIHAREYTTAELCTRFAEMLVNGYGTDADITTLVDHHEVHLILHSNPDGRIQAEAGNLWRKNTNENTCTTRPSSRGVDLNRNFPYKWNNGGSSGDQCAETYRGSAPESEPETQAIMNYMDVIFPPNQRSGTGVSDPSPDDAMGVAIDIHSYGELVLYPWGYTSTVSGNHNQFVTFGRKMAFFNDYTPQAALELYITSGTTDDTYYGLYGVAAFCIELGTSFFQACSTFENTILPDNLQTLMYAAKVARTPFMTPAGPDVLNLAAIGGSVFNFGDTVTLTANIDDRRYGTRNGVEASQNIASAEMYINVAPWETGASGISMNASDGSFNSNVESVTAYVSATLLAPGKNIIYVVGTDANGNKGAFSSIFIEVNGGLCENAGASSGQVCSTVADCGCARRHLRSLQCTNPSSCKSEACCPGFTCQTGRDKVCVADPTPSPPTPKPSLSPSTSLRPSVALSESPSLNPSKSSAPSLLECGCVYPTSSPTSSPVKSPTSSPVGPPPTTCLVRGEACTQGSEGQCCTKSCEFRGPNYRCT